ncbi:MAG TPA: VWA domain-containing protein, partial [Candidatus Sulfopaludibacter sp.]|nr:VWA domain-containing protein [Candidatus Sulfopaludibacter sp.]
MKPECLLLAFVTLTMMGQESSQSVFRVTTRLVEVNVIVRDSKGPVRGLTREDFAVFDKGKRRPIVSFSMNSPAPSPHVAVNGPAATSDSPAVFRNRAEGGPAPVNVTVVVLDGLNTEVKDQQFAKQEFLKYLKQIRPEDRIAVYALGTKLRVLNDFTSDAQTLAAAVSRHKGDAIGFVDA